MIFRDSAQQPTPPYAGGALVWATLVAILDLPLDSTRQPELLRVAPLVNRAIANVKGTGQVSTIYLHGSDHWHRRCSLAFYTDAACGPINLADDADRARIRSGDYIFMYQNTDAAARAYLPPADLLDRGTAYHICRVH